MNAYEWLTGKMKRECNPVGCVKVALDDEARLPTRAHEHDGGLDLYSREDAIIEPGKSKVFDTGVHMAIPHDFCGLVVGKSGLNIRYDVQSSGLIDSEYTGSIHVKLYNHGDQAVEIKKGQKISQLVLLPIITPVLCVVKDLEATERGNGGFGSTGRF
jgi:dUTP pyrophosphatase